MSALNAPPDKGIIEDVAAELLTSPALVEKDWYIVQVLLAIAQIHCPGYQLVFSGGTALSKGHRLMQRFSEDVDFRVIAEGNPNKTALSKFKNAFIDAVKAAGFTIKNNEIKAGDSNRFFELVIVYPSRFPQKEGYRPDIKVQVSVNATQLPPVVKPVASLVSELAQQAAEVSAIHCISPVESAADKLSALAWRVADRIRGSDDDEPEMVRHIHDLAILKDTAMRDAEFIRLLRAAIAIDNDRPKNHESFSRLPVSDKLAQLVAVLSSDKEYRGEYDLFVSGVSYAKAGTVPDFNAAMQSLEELVRHVLKHESD